MKLFFVIFGSALLTAIATFVVTILLHFVTLLLSILPVLNTVDIVGDAGDSITPGAIVTAILYLVVAYGVAYRFYTARYKAVGITVAVVATLLAHFAYSLSASLFWL